MWYVLLFYSDKDYTGAPPVQCAHIVCLVPDSAETYLWSSPYFHHIGITIFLSEPTCAHDLL
jgi:hypothetical protein